MKILVAGSNGMVGTAVTCHLLDYGYDVVRLVRRAPGPGEIQWDPDAGTIDTASLEGIGGAVQMASMPWPLRWTAKFKQAMRENRLRTNRLLAESLAGCRNKPGVLVCASGMGYYPSSGDQVLDEGSPAGTSFLANLQKDGEAATAAASQAGIRVVHLRIPPVLARTSSRNMVNKIGDGRQWVSWIGRDELARVIRFALETKNLIGPVNAVSPNPLRNTDFAATTARILGRKPGPSIPSFLLRLLLGEMADEFALSSRRMQPCKLLEAGYEFRFPKLKGALRHEFGISAQSGS